MQEDAQWELQLRKLSVACQLFRIVYRPMDIARNQLFSVGCDSFHSAGSHRFLKSWLVGALQAGAWQLRAGLERTRANYHHEVDKRKA